MKIDSYAVQTQSQYSYLKAERQTLAANVADSDGSLALAVRQDTVVMQAAATSQTQTLAMAEYAQHQERPPGQTLPQPAEADKSTAVSFPRTPKAMNKEELKIQLLDSLLYALTGKRLNTRLMELFFPRQMNRSHLRLDGHSASVAATAAPAAAGSMQVAVSQTRYERETVSYSAQGLVKTADGRTISLDVSMNMSREFYQVSAATLNLNRSPGKLVDPLVINYGGTAASLTGEKYAFDLDADGTLDQISFAGTGSGFLALDKNGDGIINDGSELFGPNTDNGFDELRGYDRDGNNWIDENDEVFKHLRIWSKDADGNDQLYTLLELGVGAIYLGDVSTPFAMKGAGDSTLGMMRSTSFFLREDGGGAGTISHIDLTV